MNPTILKAVPAPGTGGSQREVPLFSIIIVNCNGGDYIRRALASLAAQDFRDFEVFLVDNASSDGSMDNLGADLPPRLNIIQLDDNIGFAGGNNHAAKLATGTWLALLNPDAEAEPDWLSRLYAASARHPNTNMFASAQIDLNDPGRLDGAGDALFGFGIPWRGGFGRPRQELPEEGSCFSPCGAGAMYRRTTFLAHGGFDERFFCYCEDVDLGYRLRLAGEDCVFVPDAVIRHAGSGLTGRNSDFALRHGARNRM